MSRIAAISLVIVAVSTSQGRTAITVHTSDFINDASRTAFNGFESIPNDGTFYTGGAGPYVEDGISVEQINGDPPNDIWVTYWSDYVWFPNGHDNGYTRITRADGLDFANIGMVRGSGTYRSPLWLMYELYDDGSLVLSGSVSHNRAGLPAGYIGFSGGGFDEILLRDAGGSDISNYTFHDGTANSLVLNSIETSAAVPEPSTLAVWSLLTGLGFGLAWWRRRKAA